MRFPFLSARSLLKVLQLVLVGLSVATPLFLGGCAGYAIGSPKPKLFSEIHTLYVPNFKNDTLHPRMESLLASAVIKQVHQDGTYKIVDERDADAILEGTLVEIDRRPARNVRGNILQAREYTLQVKVVYTLKNRRNGRQLEQRSVVGTSSFFVARGSQSVSADVNQDEAQAIPTAAEEMAVRLVSHLSEGW
jgi:hypothetical protein